MGGGAVDLPQQAAEVVGYSEGEVGAWIFLAGRVVDWGKFANFVVDFCALCFFCGFCCFFSAFWGYLGAWFS